MARQTRAYQLWTSDLNDPKKVGPDMWEYFHCNQGKLLPAPSRSGAGPDFDWWWTCLEGTKDGDLALLYSKGEGILALIQTTSDAFELPEEEMEEFGWDYGCNWASCYHFREAVPFSAISADPILRDWYPVKVHFVKRAFDVPPAYWDLLVQLLLKHEPGLAKALRAVGVAPAAGQKSRPKEALRLTMRREP